MKGKKSGSIKRTINTFTCVCVTQPILFNPKPLQRMGWHWGGAGGGANARTTPPGRSGIRSRHTQTPKLTHTQTLLVSTNSPLEPLSTLANVTGLSLVVGLSSGMTTLASQAHGRLRSGGGSSSELRETLGAGLLVHFAFTLPVAALWMSGAAEGALVSLGQDPELSRDASEYLKRLAPGERERPECPPPRLLFYLQTQHPRYEKSSSPLTRLELPPPPPPSSKTGLLGHTAMFTLNPYCQSTSDARSPFYATLLAAALHVPLNLLLLPRMGYLGAATATSVTQSVGPAALCLLAFVFPRAAGGRPLHAGPAIPRARLVASYLRLGLPGLVTISEWWASEAAIFLAGGLPEPKTCVAAMTLYQSVNSSCFMFAVGFGVASGARVGRFLGMKEPGEARRAAWTATLSVAVVSGTLGGAMMLSDR